MFDKPRIDKLGSGSNHFHRSQELVGTISVFLFSTLLLKTITDLS